MRFLAQLIVFLLALAASTPAQAAAKPAHVKPGHATKPAVATTKPAPPAPDPARAVMACPQTAKDAEAQPKTPVKTASAATAKPAPKAAAKVDLTVCGYTLTHALHTFSDACQAEAAGATVLHAGACNGAFCPQGCSADHGVVARRVANGQIKAYDNVCWAEKDHAVYSRGGKCPWQQQSH